MRSDRWLWGEPRRSEARRRIAKCAHETRRPNPSCILEDYKAEVCEGCGVGILTPLVWTHAMVAALQRKAARSIGSIGCGYGHEDWWLGGRPCPGCRAQV